MIGPQLSKELSRNDFNIYFINETILHSCSHSIITFSELESFEWKIRTCNVANIVISNINNSADLDQVKLSLIDEVYFLDWASLNVYETYTINNIPIINHLGSDRHILGPNHLLHRRQIYVKT